MGTQNMPGEPKQRHGGAWWEQPDKGPHAEAKSQRPHEVNRIFSHHDVSTSDGSHRYCLLCKIGSVSLAPKRPFRKPLTLKRKEI